MTFVGESIWAEYPTVHAGGMNPGDLLAALRARGGTSVTVAAGADWTTDFYDYVYLEEDTDATFQLVITPLSGTATVRVTYGYYPQYSRDPTA